MNVIINYPLSVAIRLVSIMFSTFRHIPWHTIAINVSLEYNEWPKNKSKCKNDYSHFKAYCFGGIWLWLSVGIKRSETVADDRLDNRTNNNDIENMIDILMNFNLLFYFPLINSIEMRFTRTFDCFACSTRTRIARVVLLNIKLDIQQCNEFYF